MNRRFVPAVLAAALVAASCGAGGDDPAGFSASDPAPAPVEAPVPAPAPAEAEAPVPAPAPPPADSPTAPVLAPEAPSPAPEVVGTVADPTDAYFALDRVLDISIEIDSDDWDTLRNQTRTFEEVLAEIEEYALSRPFSGIYTWFSGTVTVDGETHESVGVRKKGFLGSQSSTKPALKLRFDKYVDDQALGGVMERMTLNNSVQDDSMINTCLSYRVFAAAGSPAPRCNFATVSVNGKNLGLYVHVEEIKAPFLARHFDNPDGNLYEGTVSDFTRTYRGTIEKKTNEDEDDWSDVSAVVAALEDPSDAGPEALGEIVDLDRFLSFWATEVLVGHWDGYSGNRNNFWFYRPAGGRFVFIPWGTDATFHLDDDPNPFDDIANPPPSVLALTAIPNRLYNTDGWRDSYADRLRRILEEVWDTEALLAVVDEMAAIVQRHAPTTERGAAAADTERVRKFILKRKGEILADLTPSPPDWPEPSAAETQLSVSLDFDFETAWGSNRSADPAAEGAVTSLMLDGSPEPVEDLIVTSGYSNEAERDILPTVSEPVSIVAVSVEEDGSINGVVLVLALEELVAGATPEIGTDAIAGGVFTIPPGSSEPSDYIPLLEGVLELSQVPEGLSGTVAGSFSGSYGDS